MKTYKGPRIDNPILKKKNKVGGLILPVFKTYHRASLVAQWLRIHLPMQGTWVRSLAWEDPTCHGATKPVRHNYWACTLEPVTLHWLITLNTFLYAYWPYRDPLLESANSKLLCIFKLNCLFLINFTQYTYILDVSPWSERWIENFFFQTVFCPSFSSWCL